MKRQGARTGIAIAVAAVAVALCIAACGASSSSGTKSASSASSRRAKLSACLKSHGVTFPAHARGGFPGGAGGGFAGGVPGGGAPPSGGTGASPSGGGAPPAGASGRGFPGGGGGFFGGGNSKFRTALKACGANFGSRGTAAGRRGRGFRPHFSTKTLDSFVACVKKHGYDLPKPKTTGGSIFPKSAEHNKKFLAAYQDCRSVLFAGFRGGGFGGSGGGSSGASGSA